MIAIVCGGRHYSNETRLRQILDAAVVKLGLECIIEGECPTPVNADKLARKWAEDRGDIRWIAVPAETVNGKFQGPSRNRMMLAIMERSEDKKAVFAFPGDRGTAHMVGICEAANRDRPAHDQIRIIRVDWQ